VRRRAHRRRRPRRADAVQRNAAGQHEVALLRVAEDVARDCQHYIFGHRLDARGKIHMALLEVRFGTPRRAAEQRVELPVGHRQPLAVVEVLHVQPEAAVIAQGDQVARNPILVERPAVRRQAHQLVLAAVHFEAAVVRKRGVQQAERMRELDLLRQLDAVPASGAERRRIPLAHAIERQDRRLVERAGEERTGGMRLVTRRLSTSK